MRVLVVAYRIAAGEGSESGSGYNFVRHIRQHVDEVTLVTRCDQASALVDDPAVDGVSILGYDVPSTLSWWKRGARGLIPYYYLWQLGVGRAVARIHARRPFDVVHQWNFHTDSTPHFFRVPAARVIWGPICHQPMLPMSYVRMEPIRGPVREIAKAATKHALWRFNPALRGAIQRTDVILYANRDVAAPFRAAGDLRYQTFAMGGLMDELPSASEDRSSALRLLHVGRMVSIKGAAVALEALARCDRGAAAEAKLELIGEGPLRQRLAKFAEDLGIAHRVSFTSWMSQDEVARRYRAADALLYPSLANQDSVVAEALAGGLPIIGVEGTGTEIMSGAAGLMAPRRPHRATVGRLADAIAVLAAEKRYDGDAFTARKMAAIERGDELSWEATAAAVVAIYAEPAF